MISQKCQEGFRKISFPENDSGYSHKGVGWLVWGCGQTMETSGSGRFGAKATRRVLPTIPRPLEALQLAYLCKGFGSSFLFKSISDSYIPLRKRDSSFCGELAHAFLKGKEEGGTGELGWLSEWAKVAKEMSLPMYD